MVGGALRHLVAIAIKAATIRIIENDKNAVRPQDAMRVRYVLRR